MLKVKWVCVCAGLVLLLASAGECANEEALQKSVTLNDSAIKKINRGDLDGAEADLLQALAYSSENEKVRKNLAVVYYEKGIRELKHKSNLYEAKRLLRLALDTQADHAAFRKGYALALFQEAGTKASDGRHLEALELYAEAAAYDPQNISAWIKSSHFAWKAHQITLAQEYLARAQALNSEHPDVLRMQAQLAQGVGEEVLVQKTSEHFLIAAMPDFFERFGEQAIFDVLEEAYQKVSYQLSVDPKLKLTVVFYPKRDFHTYGNYLPEHVLGFYDGKLRIPLFHPTATVKSDPIVLHEVTHAFVDHLSVEAPPKWLNEGLAQWVEGRRIQGQLLAAFQSNLTHGKVPMLNILDNHLEKKDTLAYIKSLSVVEYLIQLHGIQKIVDLVREYRKSQADTLFEKYYNKSMVEIEISWRQWIQQSEATLR